MMIGSSGSGFLSINAPENLGTFLQVGLSRTTRSTQRTFLFVSMYTCCALEDKYLDILTETHRKKGPRLFLVMSL
jgi:hypothetical protein